MMSSTFSAFFIGDCRSFGDAKELICYSTGLLPPGMPLWFLGFGVLSSVRNVSAVPECLTMFGVWLSIFPYPLLTVRSFSLNEKPCGLPDCYIVYFLGCSLYWWHRDVNAFARFLSNFPSSFYFSAFGQCCEHDPWMMMKKPLAALPSSWMISPTLTCFSWRRFRHSINSLPSNLYFFCRSLALKSSPRISNSSSCRFSFGLRKLSRIDFSFILPIILMSLSQSNSSNL